MAWLQAAIVPCVMAHAGEGPVQPAAAVGHHEHAVPAGHVHPGAAAGHDMDHAGHPCPYCPTHEAGGNGSGCDGRDCAYPHEPQVDARAVGMIFTALPVAFVLPVQAPTLATECDPSAAPEAIPRVSLTVSYCRFIE